MAMLRKSKLINWVKPASRNSFTIFDLKVRGKTMIGDLSLIDLERLRPILPSNEILDLIKRSITLVRYPSTAEEDLRLYPLGKLLKRLEACTSKEIRSSRHTKHQICTLKVGLTLSVPESKTWFNNVRLLTSVRHRNLLLKVIHGDVYTNERCYNFGLTNDPYCPRCDQLESIRHKFFECPEVSNLWQRVFDKTKQLVPNLGNGEDLIKSALCAFSTCDKIALTIHAEILQDILLNKPLREPSEHVQMTIKRLIRRETDLTRKNHLRDLIEIVT
jgi:hypothetical protein